VSSHDYVVKVGAIDEVALQLGCISMDEFLLTAQDNVFAAEPKSEYGTFTATREDVVTSCTRLVDILSLSVDDYASAFIVWPRTNEGIVHSDVHLEQGSSPKAVPRFMQVGTILRGIAH
jgi:hypothetical protein